MKSNTSTSNKIGWVYSTIGGVYIVGLGWLYSLVDVPAANQFGSDAYSGLLGSLWALSAPLGAFIVAIGAALIARVERPCIWLLILCSYFLRHAIVGTTNQMVPALFGVGGGLITLFFIGSNLAMGQDPPTLTGAGKAGSDLRMVGFIFFVVAAWIVRHFCMANYVLRTRAADKFSDAVGSTITPHPL